MTALSGKYAIGIDLGGTKIEIGLVDESGKSHHSLKLKTDAKAGPQVIQEQIIDAIENLKDKEGPLIEGIGIGVAGQIHPQTGCVIFAPNLKWHQVPLKENIENAVKLPVKVLNDVRAITWGEWLFGAGKGCDDLICVFVGTGIGSGIVSGGRLLTGCSNTLGEIGHMTIDFNGPQCTCGNNGCLEAYAGGWGISARALDAIFADGEGPLKCKILDLAGNNAHAITSKIVSEAYKQGDALGGQIIRQAQRALIAGCSSLVNAFNPCRLILGGGLIDGMPELIALINHGVHAKALKAATKKLEVVKSQLGNDAGVIGAASVVLSTLWK